MSAGGPPVTMAVLALAFEMMKFLVTAMIE
jgi:hypothetical protein